MKTGIWIFLLVLFFTGCVKSGSGSIGLGNNYSLMTSGGSERWTIAGNIFEGQVSKSIIIWNKVSKVGVTNQYIIGLRVKGGHPMHEERGRKNPQPYGYFIIDKYTGEKTLGLTEEEAKKAFTDLNISMNLLKKSSRLYTWEDE